MPRLRLRLGVELRARGRAVVRVWLDGAEGAQARGEGWVATVEVDYAS
jgi:hypothetical protein